MTSPRRGLKLDNAANAYETPSGGRVITASKTYMITKTASVLVGFRSDGPFGNFPPLVLSEQFIFDAIRTIEITQQHSYSRCSKCGHVVTGPNQF